MKKYRKVFFRNSLKSLYSEIASYGARLDFSKVNLTERDIEFRVRFFRRMKGEFIRLFRIKSRKSAQEVAKGVGIASEDFERFESGDCALPDPMFFSLCGQVGAQNEVSVFFERIEEACQAGVREGRIELADVLKGHGVTFADKEKYESRKRGRLIFFTKRNEQESESER